MVSLPTNCPVSPLLLSKGTGLPSLPQAMRDTGSSILIPDSWCWATGQSKDFQNLELPEERWLLLCCAPAAMPKHRGAHHAPITGNTTAAPWQRAPLPRQRGLGVRRRRGAAELLSPHGAGSSHGTATAPERLPGRARGGRAESGQGVEGQQDRRPKGAQSQSCRGRGDSPQAPKAIPTPPAAPGEQGMPSCGPACKRAARAAGRAELDPPGPPPQPRPPAWRVPSHGRVPPGGDHRDPRVILETRGQRRPPRPLHLLATGADLSPLPAARHPHAVPSPNPARAAAATLPAPLRLGNTTPNAVTQNAVLL